MHSSKNNQDQCLKFWALFDETSQLESELSYIARIQRPKKHNSRIVGIMILFREGEQRFKNQK